MIRAARFGLPALALAVALGASLSAGPTPVAPIEALALLARPDEGLASVAVWEARLPRFLLAVMVGGALAAAGALLQEALRNDLADPGLLGVSSGAALAVAAATVTGAAADPSALRGLGLAGGLGAAAAIVGAARLTRDPVRLVLVGAALAAAFSAAILIVTLVASAVQLRDIHFFLVGGLSGRGWADVAGVAPWLAAGALAAAALARPLALLRLGEDAASGLGLPAPTVRLAAMLAAVALTAPAVAHCGPIGFVGLVAPHAARALIGPAGPGAVVAVAAGLGAAALIVADLLARTVAAPTELPTGLVVTALGAPAALWLLRRRLARATP